MIKYSNRTATFGVRTYNYTRNTLIEQSFQFQIIEVPDKQRPDSQGSTVYN